MDNPKLDKHEFFRNLCVTAFVDGQIDDAERRVLAGIARKLKLSPRAIHDVMKGTGRYRSMSAALPESEQVRHQTFAFMVKVIVADQIVTPEERTLLHRFGETIGFSKQDVDQYVENARQH